MRIQFWYTLSQNHKPSNDYSDAVTRTLQGHFTSQDKYTAYQQNSVTVRLRSEGTSRALIGKRGLPKRLPPNCQDEKSRLSRDFLRPVMPRNQDIFSKFYDNPQCNFLSYMLTTDKNE